MLWHKNVQEHYGNSHIKYDSEKYITSFYVREKNMYFSPY